MLLQSPRDSILVCLMQYLFLPISIFCLLITLFTIFSITYLLKYQTTFSPPPSSLQEVFIPSPFEQEISAYAALDRGALYLKDNSLSGLLKNLQKKLHYFGANNRPDSTKESVYIGLKEAFSVQEKIPLYILLNKQREISLQSIDKAGSCGYLTVEKEGLTSLLVKVFPANSPNPSAKFYLYKEKFLEKETSPLFKQSKAGKSPLLLLMGKDLFLDQHGGSTFAHYKDKERINMGYLEESELLFVKKGSILTYQNEHWKNLESPHEKTEHLWLLHVDSIGAHSATLTLWSPTGEACPFHISRLPNTFLTPILTNTFKYIGAKNLKKWLFEVSGKRVTVTPGSWWLCQNKEWHELTSTQELDNYVEGSLKGELLIFEDVEIEDTEKFLKGHLFNSLRNSVHNIRLPIQ